MNNLDRQLLIQWPPMSHVTLFVTSTNIRLEHQKKKLKRYLFCLLWWSQQFCSQLWTRFMCRTRWWISVNLQLAHDCIMAIILRPFGGHVIVKVKIFYTRIFIGNWSFISERSWSGRIIYLVSCCHCKTILIGGAEQGLKREYRHVLTLQWHVVVVFNGAPVHWRLNHWAHPDKCILKI